MQVQLPRSLLTCKKQQGQCWLLISHINIVNTWCSTENNNKLDHVDSNRKQPHSVASRHPHKNYYTNNGKLHALCSYWLLQNSMTCCSHMRQVCKCLFILFAVFRCPSWLLYSLKRRNPLISWFHTFSFAGQEGGQLLACGIYSSVNIVNHLVHWWFHSVCNYSLWFCSSAVTVGDYSASDHNGNDDY